MTAKDVFTLEDVSCEYKGDDMINCELKTNINEIIKDDEEMIKKLINASEVEFEQKRR